MGYADYKRDLQSEPLDPDWILHRYFHAGQSALFQGADPSEEPRFKWNISKQIAQEFRVQCHPLQLFVCGSAHLGFSPVPGKLGKPFNSDESDVDLALVSSELFDRWWHELLEASDRFARVERDRI